MTFHVNVSGELSPLGVYVLGDNREEILPSTRDNTESIPGRDGEIDFGSTLGPRLLELHCVTPDNLTKAQRIAMRYTIAKFLNPKLGVQELTFADDSGKVYLVKVSGSTPFTPRKKWFEFYIPFKISDTYIRASTESSRVGSGPVVNDGSVEIPVIVEVTGTVTSPAVVIGGQTLLYKGGVGGGDVLAIHTGNQTVKYNGVNVLGSYDGPFPKLATGTTYVSAATAGTTTFKWHNKWI